jgi:dTDP-4-dehydrorhamnose 3,5-epimerase
MVQAEVRRIEGVRLREARGYADEAGMMCPAGYRETDGDWFVGYGDLLTLTLKRGGTRPFHYHKEGTDTVAVLAGAMRIVLYDMREGSPTRGQIQKVELCVRGETIPFLRIPPLVAHAFVGLGEHSVLVDLASSAAQATTDFFYNEPGSVPYALE